MKKLFLLLVLFCLPAHADEGKATFGYQLKKGQKAIPQRPNMRTSVIRGAMSRAMRNRR